MFGRRFATLGCFLCLYVACASGSPPGAPGPPQRPDLPHLPTAPVVTEAVPPVSAVPGPAPADPDDCMVAGPSGEPIATVALGDEINPSNAPRPSNEGERLLFRQIYETLITADCMGRLVPGLAASWRLEDDARTWIVTLREAARFSDGSPVTAADVEASWRHGGREDALQPDVSRLVESVDPIADRTLAIRLRTSRTEIPMALAHPHLAVGKAAADSPWPVGTRATRILQGAGTGGSLASPLVLARDGVPSIRFLIARGDPRDLLDHGVDLLVTRDPAALEYAAALPHFTSVPQAWRRTYFLLAPGRSRGEPGLPEHARQALANDAVRGDARGAAAPFWWQDWEDCGIPAVSPSRSQPPPNPRVVFDARDGVARDLAERFVGLARAPGPDATAVLDAILPDRPRRTFDRAAGLSAPALTTALRSGADAGYIVSADNRPIDRCRDLRALIERAPWLDPATILPLVESRVHAIVRRGKGGVTAEWDGGLLIAGPTSR